MHQVFRTTRRVEFHQTDAAGIMHFSAFFTWMETSEHDFLRSLGLGVLQRDANGSVGWPRASTRCDFLGAVRFEDEVDVEVWVRRLGESSLTCAFRFRHGQRDIAAGETTSVCCRESAEGQWESTPMPSETARKLQPFLESSSG